MRTYAEKQNHPQHQLPFNLSGAITGRSELNLDPNPLLHLQRTIGNRAVQWLLQAKPDDVEAAHNSVKKNILTYDFKILSPKLRSTESTRAKPTLSSPKDGCEQEADRIRDQVMRMPESRLRHAARLRRRAPRMSDRAPPPATWAPAGEAHRIRRHGTGRPAAHRPRGTAFTPVSPLTRQRVASWNRA